MGTALLSVSIYSSNPAFTQKNSLQRIVMLWSLLVSTAVTVEWRPHPLECDWPFSCVSKATRRWKLYRWNNSLPLRWRIWSQAPSTIWGFTPMSSTASAANMSPLRPKQVRPHLARWNQGSSQVGYSGCKSVSTSICSNSVKVGWVIMVCFLITCMFFQRWSQVKRDKTLCPFVFRHHQTSAWLLLWAVSVNHTMALQ